MVCTPGLGAHLVLGKSTPAQRLLQAASIAKNKAGSNSFRGEYYATKVLDWRVSLPSSQHSAGSKTPSLAEEH